MVFITTWTTLGLHKAAHDAKGTDRRLSWVRKPGMMARYVCLPGASASRGLDPGRSCDPGSAW